MTNVAHAKKSPVSQPSGCPCGWGRHCRCLYDWHYDHELEQAVRLLLSSGEDLNRRRCAHELMRDTIDVIDLRERDKKALIKFYGTLPRPKDIDLCRRLLNDDSKRGVWTDEQISKWMCTPIEHVGDLRARIAAVFEGNPLPVSRAWRVAAREWRTRLKTQRAAKAARRAKAVA
jgi:hypothetical protein